MEPLNINELFQVIGQHTNDIVSNPLFNNLTRALVAALAVVFLIIKGIELYYKEGDPKELIYLALVRIGWCVFLIQMYNTLFYEYLWNGIKNEIALNFGTLTVLNTMYQILLGAMGAIGVGSIFTAIGGGALVLVGGVLFVVIVAAYAGLLLGGLNAVLVASAYLVTGKFFIPLILFDQTQGYFFGWLKGFIGALMGIALWYFFMGALAHFPYWEVMEANIRNIKELPHAIGEIINIAILMVATAFISVQASSIGRNLLS